MKQKILKEYTENTSRIIYIVKKEITNSIYDFNYTLARARF